MAEKQITVDLDVDVASREEIIFEDGQSSNEWLAPYDLRLTVQDVVGLQGMPTVIIIGHEDDLLRFLEEQLPDVERSLEDVN